MYGVVFDLDDTLLPEAEYVRSGMRAVGLFCAQRLAESAPGPCAQDLSAFLLAEFGAGVRGNSFDRLLAAFPVLACAGLTTQELVDAYRTHRPEVSLPPVWQELFACLQASGVRLGVISDGPLAAQSAKAEALGLSRFCDPVILTDRWGREFWKPHERAYRVIEEAWGLPAAALWYIGDNPAKDFIAPNRLGWNTLRLRLPGQLHERAEAASPEAAARHECRSYDELRAILRSEIV